MVSWWGLIGMTVPVKPPWMMLSIRAEPIELGLSLAPMTAMLFGLKNCSMASLVPLWVGLKVFSPVIFGDCDGFGPIRSRYSHLPFPDPLDKHFADIIK